MILLPPGIFLKPSPSGLQGLLLSLVMLISSAAQAVDESVLWLPLSEQKLYPRLYALALQLEATERCNKVLRGKLHDSHGLDEPRRFFFVCQDSDYHSYSVLAEPDSGVFHYPLQVEPVEPDPAERRQALVQFGWQQCELLFAEQTRYMRELTRLTPSLAEAEVPPQETSVEGLVFHLDFDAVNLQRRPLHYRAVCQLREIPVAESPADGHSNSSKVIPADVPLEERTRVELTIKPRLASAVR